MNLTSPSQVKELLKQLDLKPSKVLGQNFLIDRNVLEILISLAELSQDDVVLEIGPGLGVLTEELLKAAKKVIAIEKDRKLCSYLRERFAGHPDLELIEADALDIDLAGLVGGGVTRMVSNLPYATGNRILMELVMASAPVERMLVTVQDDVAQRLAASPSTSDYGLLTICIQLVYDVEVRKQISPTCFLPRPKVRSALVELRRRSAPLVAVKDKALFLELVKWAFSQRRKQLGTVFRRAPCFVESRAMSAEDAFRLLDIDPRCRPEDLSVTAWADLANALCR